MESFESEEIEINTKRPRFDREETLISTEAETIIDTCKQSLPV